MNPRRRSFVYEQPPELILFQAPAALDARHRMAAFFHNPPSALSRPVVRGRWRHGPRFQGRKSGFSSFDGATASLATRRSKQPEPPERLLNRRNLLWWAGILFGRGSRRYEAKLLFAVQNPRALGHKAVLARDPLLDFLIGDAWLVGLLLAGIALRCGPSTVVIVPHTLDLCFFEDEGEAEGCACAPRCVL